MDIYILQIQNTSLLYYKNKFYISINLYDVFFSFTETRKNYNCVIDKPLLISLLYIKYLEFICASQSNKSQ